MGGTETQGFPAELMYLNVPLDGDRVGISGLLIIQTGLSNFLYGTLFAEGEGFEATLKPMLNELYANLRIEPEDTRRELDSERIASGTQLIELITPDVLRTIATETEPEIYRIYEEGPDGTPTEIGWQRLTTRLAPVEAVEGVFGRIAGDAGIDDIVADQRRKLCGVAGLGSGAGSVGQAVAEAHDAVP